MGIFNPPDRDERDDEDDSYRMVKLTVEKLDAETDKAIGVKNTKDIMQWLPKSQVNIKYPKNKKGVFEILVPFWLANQKEDLEFEEE